MGFSFISLAFFSRGKVQSFSKHLLTRAPWKDWSVSQHGEITRVRDLHTLALARTVRVCSSENTLVCSDLRWIIEVSLCSRAVHRKPDTSRSPVTLFRSFRMENWHQSFLLPLGWIRIHFFSSIIYLKLSKKHFLLLVGLQRPHLREEVQMR